MKHSSKGNFTVYEESDICSLDEYSETIGEELEDKFEEVEQEIEESAYDDTEVQNEITILQTENARIKATLPTTGEETGENITLSKTAEMEFIQPPLPRGNSEQDGEPSPTNEVPITNVTGDVEVLVQNKNLFDKTKCTEGYIDYNTGEFTSNTAFTSSDYILVEAEEQYYCNYVTYDSSAYGMAFYDKDKKYISGITLVNLITIPNNAKYIRFCVRNSNYPSGTNVTDINTVYFIKGSTATTYTPHKEQTYTFPLGTQRMYLGDYLADDGIHHVRKQVVFDGSENLQARSDASTDDYFVVRQGDYVKGTYKALNYSNYFKVINSSSSDTNKIRLVDSNGYGIHFIISKSIASTVDEFKTWLSTHNVVIELEPFTEEITPYTTEQQTAYNEIKQAISYEEQTNISGSSDESNPLFSVEAYQSTKLVLQEISNAVVALGGV